MNDEWICLNKSMKSITTSDVFLSKNNSFYPLDPD